LTGEVDDTRAARRRLKALVTVHVLAAAAWLVLPFVLGLVPPFVDLLGYPLVEHAIATRAAMVCLPIGLVYGISARGLWVVGHGHEIGHFFWPAARGKSAWDWYIEHQIREE
jgi:hypothetical protein